MKMETKTGFVDAKTESAKATFFTKEQLEEDVEEDHIYKRKHAPLGELPKITLAP